MYGANKLKAIIDETRNPMGTIVLFVLAWIAACDGVIDKREIRRLRRIADSSGYLGNIDLLLQVAGNPESDLLVRACEILKHHIHSVTDRELFLALAVSMSLADRRIVPAENHVLHFFCDLLALPDSALGRIFKEASGVELPEPSDPSSRRYWAKRSARRETSAAEKGSRQRIEALSVLGLLESASPKEVKAAYRRLARVHHPDRFVSLGAEAVAASTITFQRINGAYEQVRADA